MIHISEKHMGHISYSWDLQIACHSCFGTFVFLTCCVCDELDALDVQCRPRHRRNEFFMRIKSFHHFITANKYAPNVWKITHINKYTFFFFLKIKLKIHVFDEQNLKRKYCINYVDIDCAKNGYINILFNFFNWFIWLWMHTCKKKFIKWYDLDLYRPYLIRILWL